MRIPLSTALLALFAAAAAPLPAQDLFRATLDGSQVVLPSGSDAGGWGTFALQPDGSVVYHLETWGLSATSAHVHVGAPGQTGPILVPLVGGPTEWDGQSLPLSPTDVAILQDGGTYVNVHTLANPFGEIRGQILPSPNAFAALADGGQVVPPTGSTATGTGTFVVQPDRSIVYDFTANVTAATAAHLHVGPPGVSGGILFPLTMVGANHWMGTTAPMTPDQYTDLQHLGMYVNVHTMAFPGGEIRGQLVSSGESYGFGCGGPLVLDCTLSTSGAPLAGSTVTLQVAGGEPSGSGFLGISLAPDSLDLGSGCGQLVAAPILTVVPIALDAAGDATLPLNLPPLAASVTGYLQFAGFGAGGLEYTSNGWALTVTAF